VGEFAGRALKQATPATGDHWHGRLVQITTADWETLINRTPEMSEASRTFCIRLLTTNQRRLLDGV
jgi:hypothetical protein